MINRELARIFKEISIFLDMRKIPFKPRAYEKIADAIDNLEEDLGLIYKRGGLAALQQIPGIGKSSAEKIEEYIKTGKINAHEELKKETPLNLKELSRIEGLGPSKIKALHEKLGIKNLKDLETALAGGKIHTLSGFGEKSAENIKKRMAALKEHGERFVLGYVFHQIEDIKSKLSRVPGVEKVELAGSARRRRDSIGDADFLVVSDGAEKVMDVFTGMSDVEDVIAKGDTKSSVRLLSGLDVDLRVVPKKSYGSALMYFTGSKAHNIALREIAMAKGMKLNEYGLFKGSKQVAGKTEEEIYEKLGLSYVPPELREDLGEIDLAVADKLPKLVELGDIQGDLQVQTNWTDGIHTIKEMAEEAIKLGRKYMLVTDHTKRLTVAKGLDEARLRQQMKEIDALNAELKKEKRDFLILKGSECDILKDGSLDLSDEILSELDVVGASIHSHFNLPEEEQTKRMKRAMANKHVDIIFHPTGRIINKRGAYALDVAEIIRYAKETGTVLEINAYPERADLKDEYIRRAVELGVKLSIDTDSHSIHHLKFMQYGVWQARRGWAKKSDIVNAYPVDQMLKMLK